MFGDLIGEIGASTGTGTYSMGGVIVGSSNQAWRTQFGNGAVVGYLATTRNAQKREVGWGVFGIGTPDTLTRNVVRSSQANAPVDWQADDAYYLYSVPLGFVLAAMANGGLGAELPEWAQQGWGRLDTTVEGIWRKLRHLGDEDESEEGRHYLAEGIFAASQRAKFVDIGAANYVFTKDDIGKVLAFNSTAAPRMLTMLAHDADGMGEGAYVYVLPYSTAALNPSGVTFTPGGSDVTTLATAPANRMTKFQWDAARSKWVADYAAPAATVYPPGTIAGLTYANNGTDAANDIDIASGGCMDATGAVYMALSALTKRLDGGNWAVGTNQPGLDTGSIADTDYYIWAIKRSDTGVTDILFSTSNTAPTMPANYDYKRLIGWFKRASSAIVAFKTWEMGGGGLAFRWNSPTLDINLSNTLGTSRRLDPVKVPTTFETDALVTVSIDDASTNTLARICSPAEADGAPSATAVPLANMNRNAGSTNEPGEFLIRTNSSGQIAARATTATVDTYCAMTLGFNWSRR